MSDDDSDKTVFQAFRPGGDSTVMKPSPGRRRPAPAGRSQDPITQPARTAAPTRAPAVDADAAYFRTSAGLNPIVDAATSLLAVLEQTRQSTRHADIGGLHQRLTNEIRAFEERLRGQGVRNEVVLSARYLICTVLDEAVLNTPWGSSSPWAQRTLLSIFHNETAGGEKSFLILDRLRQSPAENIEMLELFYICLSLGFEGKYRIAHRGRDQLESVRNEIFNIIRTYRGEYERALSDSWRGLGRSHKTLVDHLPMWVLAVILAGILFFGYSGFRYWLYDSATPVAEKLDSIIEAETK